MASINWYETFPLKAEMWTIYPMDWRKVLVQNSKKNKDKYLKKFALLWDEHASLIKKVFNKTNAQLTIEWIKEKKEK